MDEPAPHARPARSPGAWERARVRLAPRLLAEASPAARDRFEHEWAPVEALRSHLRLLPAAVWDYLLGGAGGYALITPGPSQYVPGESVVRGRALRNVAMVSIDDLAAVPDSARPLHVIGHLIDHYLGCAGRPGGAWLSAGGGVTARWQEAGARLARLYVLGYAVDEVAAANVQDYLAQSLAVYCHDHRRLNVADPQIEKWLRTTLFDEHFWQ